MIGAVSAGVISGVLSGLASTAVTAAIAKFGVQMKTASTVGGGGGGLPIPPVLTTAAGGTGILASLSTAAGTLGTALAGIGATGAAVIAAVGVASAAAGAAIGNMRNERVARGDITQEQATMEASQQGGQPMFTPAPGSAAAREMKQGLSDFFDFINPFDGGKDGKHKPAFGTTSDPMTAKYGSISAHPMNDKYSVQVYLGAESVADPLEKIIVDRVRDGGRPNNY